MAFKVGCIGAGYFAAFHYDAWRRIGSVELVAAVDQDLGKAQATGLNAFTDAHAMLSEVKPDIVDIITPPPTHFETISIALQHAPKAIICQKPFCLSMGEARQAASLCTEAGVPLVVHENFRFQPWYRVIKALLDKGELGDVLQITFRLRPGDGQGEDAYLDRQPYFQQMPRFLVHETAVHWIDTFRYLIGNPERVFADLRQLNPVIAGEDAGYLMFDHGGGVRAVFDGNRLLDHAASNTRCTMGEALIEGTKGTLTLKGDGSLHRRAFGSIESRQVLAPTKVKGFGGDCVYHLQMHVVRALEGNGALENTAEDYLKVMEIEDAVYRSAQSGAWVKLDD
ncbi:MAG: Gfo/Idh/MocA family oxidoreductase [Pseudomonadota bacterium]